MLFRSGENRVLVCFGLRYLAHSDKPGLRALMRAAGLEPGSPLEAGQVGFVLGPRINAVGRMGDADLALRLLLTTDAREAERLAGDLERVNRLRRDEDRATLEQAIDRLPEEFDSNTDFGVVLSGEGWHPGVIGIVASRLVERLHRPVVLVALEGDRLVEMLVLAEFDEAGKFLVETNFEPERLDEAYDELDERWLATLDPGDAEASEFLVAHFEAEGRTLDLVRVLERRLARAHRELEEQVPHDSLHAQLERWREQWRPQVERDVREELVLDAVARERGIEVEEAELDARLDLLEIGRAHV